MERECGPQDEAVVREPARRFFPDACGPGVTMATCLYANSPDEHFVVDRHPTCSDVWLAGGFSGHGFKFATVIGEVMADLVERGRTDHEIGLFRLGRFAHPSAPGCGPAECRQ